MINKLTPAQRVVLARHADRPNAAEYIDALFTEFFALAGDRRQADDESIIGGVAFYKGEPVTVIAHRKGKTLEENLRYRFGMPNPEGYRKAERLMKQADKFGRPIITFIDTPGAYPGLEAEERGQGEAIASCLATMSALSVPVVSVVIGEGGSGGALAIGVSDKLIMLENAVFSVLSPEGFASILWKDSSRYEEAADIMKLTAEDLQGLGIADVIVPEPLGGAHTDKAAVFMALDAVLSKELNLIKGLSAEALCKLRYKRLRQIGSGGKEF